MRKHKYAHGLYLRKECKQKFEKYVRIQNSPEDAPDD
jgi:hypothetical protein